MERGGREPLHVRNVSESNGDSCVSFRGYVFKFFNLFAMAELAAATLSLCRIASRECTLSYIMQFIGFLFRLFCKSIKKEIDDIENSNI